MTWIFGYVVELAKATRENEWTELGLSPRGTVCVDSYGESMCVAEWTGICRSFRCTGNISVCHRASDHSEYESEVGHIKKEELIRRFWRVFQTPTMRQKY